MEEKVHEEWEAWKRHHNKDYESEHEHHRARDAWKENDEFIRRHNAEFEQGEHTFTTGHNKYSDLNEVEFALIKGFDAGLHDQNRQPDADTTLLGDAELPESVDWREQGYLNPVQDQGQCGSCYAFSSVAAIESQYFKKNGTLIKLSEQNVVDCSTKNGNNGGQGGTMDNVFRYVIENGGIDSEESYPYKAAAGHCRYKPDDSLTTISGYKDIPQGDEKALTQAIATVGPVCVGIDASQKSFQLYKSGIYYDKKCSSQPDHAVVAVGYGSDGPGQDYYIVRNSWSESWGDAGYIKMARNRNGAAAIASMASYPIIDADTVSSGGDNGTDNQYISDDDFVIV